jgi:hypothetical protein
VFKAGEYAVRSALGTWRRLSLDAKIIGALAIFNWLLLFQKHTVLTVTTDTPIWTLFPIWAAPLYLLAVGALAVAYPLRDLKAGRAFDARQRWLHLAGLIAVFIVIPTVAAMVLRATGKPYTYIHDGALMAEEAARKLLAGRNPYSVDYLDTPLFYWPMVNNPALYHFTYFPLLFLATIPPMAVLLPTLGWFDERVLFLPAMLGSIAVGASLLSDVRARLALAGALALNPQFFPFVVEGRNDAFVLLFVLLTAYFLQRERPALAGLALGVAVGTKLHAVVLVPFFFVYLLARARPSSISAAWRAVAPAALPFLALSAVVFAPFIAWDWASFYDDIVAYNAGFSAWSYPVAGIGFSVLLHAIGLIPHRGAEFPFWAFQLAAGIPVAFLAARRLWRTPTIALLLTGYALTLLAFLFFGRYFQTNYLGYIAAVATPAFFLAQRAPRRIALRRALTSSPSVATADPVYAEAGGVTTPPLRGDARP